MISHSRVATIAAALLVGCSEAPNIELDKDQWICTRIGEVEHTQIVPTGKVAIPITRTKQACTRYERP